ncbi:hypothetical protein GDO81_029685 [Engystomops pustulosus]|uniref:Uncharacterized protein n=1 Tax=Engystomops pustulosus TaxID=76066 RepID=A0AAV6YBU8_ENGPU|nr:hypothetical protein GDO81_029685 [Engystomops pustulosus]
MQTVNKLISMMNGILPLFVSNNINLIKCTVVMKFTKVSNSKICPVVFQASSLFFRNYNYYFYLYMAIDTHIQMNVNKKISIVLN